MTDERGQEMVPSAAPLPPRPTQAEFDARRAELNGPIARNTYVPELAALDRCEHGRHKADNCNSCPGGQSTGNLFLTPGQRIGTTLYGDPIIAPDHDQRGHSENWVPGDLRRIK